ncbi:MULTISPECIES: FadR/GntR family transcriptional regulator [unclassified Streptomyces]|uniref:FadR/GntR family transcriptional regulator n=1 Tax=unclassified Streptomyces TaxID=2593676 RepID=UPI001904F034|nr:FadR/GntR family transcriptional regulator [Streptomyces sp. HSG2]
MESALAHLRGSIERGEYGVGDRLPSEAELCRGLAVSRPVLREALRALQTLGLTVSRTGSGTYVVADAVADPTFGDYAASDLMEVRRHVEVPVAGYAAERRTGEQLDGLSRLLDRMEREYDTVTWAALDTRFHLTVAEAARNPVFRRVVEEIRDALARQSAFLDGLDGRRAQADREHRAVLFALADRSPRDARHAMNHHLDRVEQTLARVVRPTTTATADEAASSAPPPGNRGK